MAHVRPVKAPSGPLRVLAFVEARGVTGALRNLLDVARISPLQPSPFRFEVATYWRSPAPGLPGPGTDEIGACLEAVAAAGLKGHVLHERGPGDRTLVPQIRALIGERRPDVIETEHVKSHLLAALAGASRLRWVAFHHGYTRTDLRVRTCNLFDYWSLRRATRVLTPCRAFADDLRRRGVAGARIEVIHNAVVPPAAPSGNRDRLRAALNISAGDGLVVAVGRLSNEKGHAVLIAALAQPHLAGSSRTSLILVGDGPERAALEAQAAKLGVADRVHFVGQQPDPWPYYYAADAVALPSDTEGSPNALLEAMAAGAPIVATRVGGVPEIIDDGQTGLLVPPRSPVAMARALSDVLRAPRLAESLGARARAAVEERFSVERRAARLGAFYHGMCTCAS